MPTSDEILSGLTDIANRFMDLAGLWHLVVLIVVLSIARWNWRPSLRLSLRLLSLPLVSVSALAWKAGNSFNGVIFAALAAVSFAFAERAPRAAARRGPAWAVGVGIAAIAYAWLYPHFLVVSSAVYFVASPMGLIPCPTLSMILGFLLLGGGLGSRAVPLAMGVAGLFYALFGIFRLGVLLDAGLLVAAAATVALAMEARENCVDKWVPE
jgi:hypothetical protein